MSTEEYTPEQLAAMDAEAAAAVAFVWEKARAFVEATLASRDAERVRLADADALLAAMNKTGWIEAAPEYPLVVAGHIVDFDEYERLCVRRAAVDPQTPLLLP